MKTIHIPYPSCDVLTVHREWFDDGSPRVIVCYADGTAWTVGPPPDGQYLPDGTRTLAIWHNRWEAIV